MGWDTNLKQKENEHRTSNIQRPTSNVAWGRHWAYFGLRRQSAAATPLFDGEQNFQSGVAHRFPPQSNFFWLRLDPRPDFAKV
jgi:hypothetical protein